MRRVATLCVLFITSIIYPQSENWRIITTNTQQNLYGYTQADLNDWPFTTTQWAVTESGVLLRTRDDWNSFEPVQIGDEKINRVNWEFNKDGTASRIIGVGENGTIVVSKDGGDNWEIKNSGTTNNLNAVDIVYSSESGTFHSWAVGESSTILHSSDGGQNWNSQEAPFQFDNLEGVSFKGPDSGIAVGKYGVTYQTTNGGNIWEYKDANTMSNFNNVSMGKSGKTALAVGDSGLICLSRNSGESWTKINSGVSENLNSVASSNSESFYVGGDNGTLLNIKDSGSVSVTHIEKTTKNINNVYSDGKNHYGVGDSGIIVTNKPPKEPGPFNSKATIAEEKKGVVFSWNDSSMSAERYHIGRKEKGDSGNIFDFSTYQEVGSTTSTSFEDSDVEENTKYYYTAIGYNGSQYSHFSPPVEIDYGLHPPSDLVVSFDSENNGQVNLSWTNSSENMTTSCLYRKDSSTIRGSSTSNAIKDEGSFQLIAELPKGTAEYVDATIELNQYYFYKLQVVNDSSESAYSNTAEIFTEDPSGIDESEIPTEYKLFQNYPNPFNPRTNIAFQIPSKTFVSIIIYNVLGKEIVNLINEEMLPGYYNVEFDGSELSSGVYFYKLETKAFIDTKKFVLLK